MTGLAAQPNLSLCRLCMPRTKKSARPASEADAKRAAAGAPAEEKEAKASESKSGKKAGRGPAEPFTVAQYDLLLEYFQWLFPRPPEKRAQGAKVTKELSARIKSLFRSLRNFNSEFCASTVKLVGL